MRSPEQSPNEMALLRASVVLLFGLLPAAAFAPMGVSRPAQASHISLRATASNRLVERLTFLIGTDDEREARGARSFSLSRRRLLTRLSPSLAPSLESRAAATRPPLAPPLGRVAACEETLFGVASTGGCCRACGRSKRPRSARPARARCRTALRRSKPRSGRAPASPRV